MLEFLGPSTNVTENTQTAENSAVELRFNPLCFANVARQDSFMLLTPKIVFNQMSAAVPSTYYWYSKLFETNLLSK